MDELLARPKLRDGSENGTVGTGRPLALADANAARYRAVA